MSFVPVPVIILLYTFRFGYLYIWGRTDKDRTELFVLYISNWDFNKKFGLGVMYSMIIILLFPSPFSHNYFTSFQSMVYMFFNLDCHSFLIPVHYFSNLLSIKQFLLSSPCGNTRSWSWHQNLWCFLLLLFNMSLLLFLV